MAKTTFGTNGLKSGNIAFCGLYCEECGKYTKEKCPGCAKNEKATWCAIRKCCIENSYRSCAECATYTDPKECGLYNNFIAKVIGFIFRTDRSKGIDYIRKNGYAEFARHMDSLGCMSMKK